MKTKILLALTVLFSFGPFATPIKNEKLNTQATDIVITVNVQPRNLPLELVLGQNLPTYEYEGDEMPDFRRYFTITANREPILDMWQLDPLTGEMGIDKGGYEWNFIAFNIDKLGQSPLFIIYNGQSARVNFKVVEFDTTPPYIFEYENGIPIVKPLPAIFQIEAGDNLPQQFVRFFVGDNVDDETQLVRRNENGEYEFKPEYFPNYHILDNAEANIEYELQVRVHDKAGNLYQQDIIVIIRDTTPPTIFNIPNIEIKKGTTVDYTANVRVQDNLSSPENITIIYDIVDKNDLNIVLGDESDIENLFDTLGEHNIRVRAIDENGNTTTYDLSEFGSGSGAQDDIYEFTQELNLEGEVVIKIYATGAKGNQQATFDNFAWVE